MWNPSPTPVSGTQGQFTCSGIVVTAGPGRLAEVRRALEGMEGLRVHQEDPASGRLVVTQVAGSDAEQARGLERIQKVPGVLAADLVYYHREEPDGDPPAPRKNEEQEHE